MQIKDKAIVLQCIKYADKKHIVKLFTREHGLVTCMARVSNSPSSKIRSSSLMSLNLIEAEINKKESKEMQLLTEASCYYIYTTIHSDFKKLSVVQFINEVLQKTLKDQTSQPELFDFISNSLIYLNETEANISNFHHYFLLTILEFFGIEPINNFDATNKFFDCREGKFTPYELAYPLGLNEISSVIFSRSLSVNVVKEKLSNSERSNLLDSILAYYKIHLPGFNDVKSLEVLKEIALA
ncbi:MAG: DNA repair protein RecO [Sphingobacteriaceae bacterium]|jgi:DNA repair protein RecO (recombination protein O)